MSSTVLRVGRKWNPQSYLQFESARLRPAFDLLNQINPVTNPLRIVDLGCGTGNMTKLIRNKWPESQITCVDSSNEMLERARKDHEAIGLSNIEYVKSNFETFSSPDPVDIIFSNAALHWVSYSIHETLLPRLIDMLNPQGGILAFQMPDSRSQNSHLMMQEAARDISQDVKNVRWVTTEVDPDVYYDLLSPYCQMLDIWSSTYSHVLTGDNPVADFTASTALGPFVDACGGIESDKGKAFVAKYRELIAEKYPSTADQKTLFPMKRFFVVAQR